ncbi:hypothetical protein RN12_3352 [Mycobacterium tuberculosis]|nr:hypothetical protein RN11_3632 [Mycobacterium tuberculosis]AMC78961.1 hypothetical protein RN12_3352 [Mycobacterium tuberculosis]
MYSGCWINNQNGETRVGEDSLEDLEQRRARLYDQLAATGDFRRGSISENYRRCGKPNCVCAQEGHPGHGPRYLWTRTVAGRGTKGRQLSVEEVDKVRAELANYHRFAQVSEQIVAVNEAICEARPPNPAATAPRPAQRGTKKGALRPDRGGVHRRGRAAGCARGRCAGILGADLVAVELAIRTAMTRLGSSLLEQLLGADTGHRGQRIDCGQGHCAWFVGYRDKNLDTVLDRVRLLRACYHCRTCGRGMAPPGSGTWPPRSCPKPPRSWTSTTLASTSTTSPASSHPPSANTTVTG